MNQEALQKVLIEMDNQLNQSRAELSMVNLQLDRANTNLKIIETTKTKLNDICKPSDRVWQGCGKAFLAKDVKTYLGDLDNDQKEYQDTKKSLTIKQEYLQTTLEKTLEGMTNIVGEKK
ncbi:Prefoldin subunit 1 [Candida viswanathii]|uniref:Prefoldin subunit 1 n=1 Tax=Candida viswanathii TaxID=5486 RepID=A0A367Y764_9ASCO|nr:Prefoldin subunit 1 [Candida viswanathii]RCK60882.1 Prefoldin subunit 1 [Candida viswanathii]